MLLYSAIRQKLLRIDVYNTYVYKIYRYRRNEELSRICWRWLTIAIISLTPERRTFSQ